MSNRWPAIRCRRVINYSGLPPSLRPRNHSRISVKSRNFQLVEFLECQYCHRQFNRRSGVEITAAVISIKMIRKLRFSFLTSVNPGINDLNAQLFFLQNN